MRVLTQDQRSTEWKLERRGRITASRIRHMLDMTKKGADSAARINYRLQLIAERTTGEISPNYVSPEMDYGTEQEDYARAEYEIESGNFVSQAGFVLHPEYDFTGASPDGLIGKDGAIEIKVPKSETHIKWMQEGILPEDHEPQCMWVLACTGRKYIDFVSFDPRQKQLPRLFIVRLNRDEERIAQIEAEVRKFDAEIEAEIAELRKRVKPSPEVPKRSAYDEVMEMMEELIP